MNTLRRLALRLPERFQTELKRIHYARQIATNSFVTDEPEYAMLGRFIQPLDWVIDVGANVGRYTKRFSELVGSKGRVIAFEPVPATFGLLAANVQQFQYCNVTLLNVAASDKTEIVGMSIPKSSTGQRNYYEAGISGPDNGLLFVLTMPIDALCIPKRVSLVKIDVEGHESSVLSGMRHLIAEHRPVLIVEVSNDDVIHGLSEAGYTHEQLPHSPNMLFMPA